VAFANCENASAHNINAAPDLKQKRPNIKRMKYPPPTDYSHDEMCPKIEDCARWNRNGANEALFRWKQILMIYVGF
jgi:hypothetical protein